MIYCYLCRKPVDMDDGTFGPYEKGNTTKVVPVIFICLGCIDRCNLFLPRDEVQEEYCNCIEYS